VIVIVGNEVIPVVFGYRDDLPVPPGAFSLVVEKP
jgi:hypothetical protein